MERPDDYVRAFFKIEPEPHQVEAMRSVAKPGSRTAIVGANGMGKDACVSWLPSWFLYCFGGPMGQHALVPTTSASGRQIETLWRELNGWMTTAINLKAFDPLNKELRLTASPHNKAVGFKALSQQVMESFHAPHLLYIMTEARACEDWAYLSMFKACTGADNRIVIQSVPGEMVGMFYEIARGEVPGWNVLFWPAARKVWYCATCDGPIEATEGLCVSCAAGLNWKYVPTSKQVTDQSIQEKLAFGEDSEFFQAPVLANFLTGSSLQLITLKEYHDAEDRYGPLRTETVNGIAIPYGGITESLPDILGVDCAWVGQNNNVMCHRKGSVVHKFWRWQGNKGKGTETRVDTTDLIDRVMQWMNAHPSGVVVTENGIAQSSLIDHLIKAKYGARLHLVNPGGPPLGGEKEAEMFHDRRSQLYFYLQQRFRKGTIALKDTNDELKKQLTGIRAKVRTDVKFQIESKDELKKRMPSPDDADALMLTMAGSSDMSKAATIGDIMSIGVPVQRDWW